MVSPVQDRRVATAMAVLEEAVPSMEVVERAGISYRQFDHWCRAGWLRPLNPAPGHGARREFSPEEAAVAVCMGGLVAAGVRPEAAHEIARGDKGAVRVLLAAVERSAGLAHE